MLGYSTGSDELHYLLEGAFDGDRIGDAFLHDAYGRLSFATGPLYAALHEPCYAQGAATRWSAQRIRAEFPGFDPGPALEGAEPLLFTGEMIYPWMFGQDPVLRPFQEAASLVAEYADWPPLYDAARLAANEVPVAAAIYFDDMYVPTRAFCADRGGDTRPARLGHQRVRARRAAAEQRRGAAQAHRPGAGPGLTPAAALSGHAGPRSPRGPRFPWCFVLRKYSCGQASNSG